MAAVSVSMSGVESPFTVTLSRNLTDFELKIHSVRLVRDNSYTLEDLLLEARLLYGEGIFASSKGVEVINSARVGRGGQRLVRVQIL